MNKSPVTVAVDSSIRFIMVRVYFQCIDYDEIDYSSTCTCTKNHAHTPRVIVRYLFPFFSRAHEQSERVLQVLKNLAPRYGEVMQILAQLQLLEMQQHDEGMDGNNAIQPHVWVDYKVFRAACKSRFVIDKDSKLRTLQTELSDHHLLMSKYLSENNDSFP